MKIEFVTEYVDFSLMRKSPPKKETGKVVYAFSSVQNFEAAD